MIAQKILDLTNKGTNLMGKLSAYDSKWLKADIEDKISIEIKKAKTQGQIDKLKDQIQI